MKKTLESLDSHRRAGFLSIFRVYSSEPGVFDGSYRLLDRKRER